MTDKPQTLDDLKNELRYLSGLECSDIEGVRDPLVYYTGMINGKILLAKQFLEAIESLPIG